MMRAESASPVPAAPRRRPWSCDVRWPWTRSDTS